MTLSDEAKTLAKELVQAWNDGVIESYFTLVDVTAGNVASVQLAPGLGILRGAEFNVPKYATLMELANHQEPQLLTVIERASTHRGRQWDVSLTQGLREAVYNDFRPLQQRKNLSLLSATTFISYSRQDRSFTEELAGHLVRVFGSESVWFDKALFGGTPWWDEIIRNIERLDHFIYVLSGESLESVYCRFEFTEALRFGKHVFPLRLRQTKYLPSILGLLQIREVSADITAAEIVEIIAALVQADSSRLEGVNPESLWGKRTVTPMEDRKMSCSFNVPANVEPDSKHRELCNTGILVVPGDEITIRAKGKVTIDDGSTWMDANGIYPHPETGEPIFYYTPEAYRFSNYISSENKGCGVVGALFGWIGDDEKAMLKAFFVGEDHTISVDKYTKGFLHLAVCDAKGTYGDNRGEFEVTVEVKNG